MFSPPAPVLPVLPRSTVVDENLTPESSYEGEIREEQGPAEELISEAPVAPPSVPLVITVPQLGDESYVHAGTLIAHYRGLIIHQMRKKASAISSTKKLPASLKVQLPECIFLLMFHQKVRETTSEQEAHTLLPGFDHHVEQRGWTRLFVSKCKNSNRAHSLRVKWDEKKCEAEIEFWFTQRNHLERLQFPLLPCGCTPWELKDV